MVSLGQRSLFQLLKRNFRVPMSWSSLFSGMQPSIFLTSHCIQLHWPHSFPCPLLHPYCGARSDKARRKVIATILRFITRQAIQLHSPSYVPLKTSCTHSFFHFYLYILVNSAKFQSFASFQSNCIGILVCCWDTSCMIKYYFNFSLLYLCWTFNWVN